MKRGSLIYLRIWVNRSKTSVWADMALTKPTEEWCCTETTEDSAEYVILYVWGDDHLRNAMRCRYAAIYPWWDHQGGLAFHNNFWTRWKSISKRVS